MATAERLQRMRCCHSKISSMASSWRSSKIEVLLSPVLIISRVLDPEQVCQQDLLVVQRIHLALGAPVPQHADGEQNGCMGRTDSAAVRAVSCSLCKPRPSRPIRQALVPHILLTKLSDKGPCKPVARCIYFLLQRHMLLSGGAYAADTHVCLAHLPERRGTSRRG